MTRNLIAMALAGAATIAAAPASATDKGNGAPEILRGDYVAAERAITNEQRLWPAEPDLMLNLASVYRHTGRMAEARATYRAVLARPDDQLDMPDGRTLSAHGLARDALRAMDGTQMSAR